MKISVKSNMPCDIQPEKAVFTPRVELLRFVMKLDFTFDANGDEYILFPASVYDGNRFAMLDKKVFAPEDMFPDMPLTVFPTAPHLNRDGSGDIRIKTGNVSVPCCGVFSRSRKKAFLVFTTQGIENGLGNAEKGQNNFGMSYTKGCFTIFYPGTGDFTFPVGSRVEIPYKLLEFDCESITAFYRVFFENRKIMEMPCERPLAPDWNEIFSVQEDKYNRMNWYENLGCYGCSILGGDPRCWQPGWTGGAISSYPLLKLGGRETKERAIKTLEFLFKTQRKSGFFTSMIKNDDSSHDDFFGYKSDAKQHVHLIRKSADVLYYLFKHFLLMQEVPPSFEEGTKKLADAFVKLWDTYGQFGQFVDSNTGKLLAGNSASGGIAPAGLAAAYRYFQNTDYLRVAEASARMMYERDICAGVTGGGPGDAIQSPDSESAFALLESYVALYEETKNPDYLKMAQDTAHLCSSWVVAYNFRFPSKSEFARLGIRSVGTVFANVKNKHSAPGICTYSGECLRRLWKYTGDALYMELLKDIYLAIPQCMSTEERPVYNHSVQPPTASPPGFACERVNTSDWEGYGMVGNIWGLSTWPEVSLMLTIAEIV
ncbi:MAG: hypothetical protein LBQ48_00940 [Oscillospiraceae bacterium]|nr:hypothetical protein [Oscillospiraceae bacterium]